MWGHNDCKVAHEVVLSKFAKTQKMIMLSYANSKVVRGIDKSMKNSHSKIAKLEAELKKARVTIHCNFKKLHEISLAEKRHDHEFGRELVKYIDSIFTKNTPLSEIETTTVVQPKTMSQALGLLNNTLIDCFVCLEKVNILDAVFNHECTHHVCKACINHLVDDSCPMCRVKWPATMHYTIINEGSMTRTKFFKKAD